MTITDILSPDRIIPELKATTKEGVLEELAGVLADDIPGATVAKVASVLRDRERLTSTAIGDGIAIPHGRLGGTRNIVAGFARSSGGIAFDSVDQRPTHLFFVLIAPDDAAAMHLKALARISRLLKDKEFRSRLLETDDRQALFDVIAQEDAKL